MALIPRASGRDLAKAAGIVFLGLSILAFFLLLLGGRLVWESQDTYHSVFSTVKELTAGRAVRYAGIQVGRVKDIVLNKSDPTMVHVELGISKDFTVYGNMTASIAQRGLVGETYVLLELKGQPGEKLPPGSTIPVRQAASLPEVAGELGTLLSELRPRLDRIAAGLEQVFSDENMDNFRRTLSGTATLTGEDTSRRLTGTLDRASQLMDRTRQAVVGLENETKRTGEAARKLAGTAGTTAARAGEDLSKTLASLRKSLEEIESKTGRLLEEAKGLAETARTGVAFDQEKVEDILYNMETASQDLISLTRSLRERPWLILRGPGRGGQGAGAEGPER